MQNGYVQIYDRPRASFGSRAVQSGSRAVLIVLLLMLAVVMADFAIALF